MVFQFSPTKPFHRNRSSKRDVQIWVSFKGKVLCNLRDDFSEIRCIAPDPNLKCNVASFGDSIDPGFNSMEEIKCQSFETHTEMECLLSGPVISETSFSSASKELSRSVPCPHEFPK